MTLKRIAEKGPREFYEGETAKLIASDMKANNGLIALEDLKTIRLKSEPRSEALIEGTRSSLCRRRVLGVCHAQVLNMLEEWDIASMGHNSAAKYHLLPRLHDGHSPTELSIWQILTLRMFQRAQLFRKLRRVTQEGIEPRRRH